LLDLNWTASYYVVERVQNSAFEKKERIMPAQANAAPSNSIIVAAYIVYLLISIAVTVWVARILHKRGAIFLVDAFHGNAELAASVNHLLVVGFYLINIGYVSLALKTEEGIFTPRAAIELLSEKIGMVLLILGAMHFFNLFVFSRIRRHGFAQRVPVVPAPPVAPNAILGTALPR
jgi:hypothetical protein